MRGFSSVVTHSYNGGSLGGTLGICAPNLSQNFFQFHDFLGKNVQSKESIPVGCIPPAFLVWWVGGVCPTHLDADPPGYPFQDPTAGRRPEADAPGCWSCDL